MRIESELLIADAAEEILRQEDLEPAWVWYERGVLYVWLCETVHLLWPPVSRFDKLFDFAAWFRRLVTRAMLKH